MASIAREPNGRRTIQFIGADGKRRTIRLGKVSQRLAEAVKVKVESLATAQLTGHPPDDETSRWVAGLDAGLADKLASAGLIPNRESATLKAFIDGYLADRTDMKPSTQQNCRQAASRIIGYFGAERSLRDITPGECDQWRLWLADRGMGEVTIRRVCGRAKQFFKAALRRKLIAENPFADLKSASLANPTRFYYVTRVEAAAVLNACPNAEWRLLFALARFGGLRIPSEAFALTWGDVDWERGRLRVPSPKTEHHEGHAERIVPLFPELREHLETAFDEAEPGTQYVITRYRDPAQNIRTQFQRIIRRAGLTPWEKLFQNLRSTRETELCESFPLHVVTAWLGNSAPVAMKHYLQVTDEHFDRAVSDNTLEKALQNPVQQAHETARNDPQRDRAAHEKTPVLQAISTDCEIVQNGGCPHKDSNLEPSD